MRRNTGEEKINHYSEGVNLQIQCGKQYGESSEYWK